VTCLCAPEFFSLGGDLFHSTGFLRGENNEKYFTNNYICSSIIRRLIES
jgi:hypothetical protein